jgi:hypothetical protein
VSFPSIVLHFKFVDARDACFPKTPGYRSFKKNLDFVLFSNFQFQRPAKLEGGKLTVLGRNYHLLLPRLIPENGKPKSWQLLSCRPISGDRSRPRNGACGSLCGLACGRVGTAAGSSLGLV